MDSNITVALISGACVAIPSIVATVLTSNGNRKLTEYQIKELSDKVEKHNQLIERMYKVETDVKTAFKRIDDLRADLHGKDKKDKDNDHA